MVPDATAPSGTSAGESGRCGNACVKRDEGACGRKAASGLVWWTQLQSHPTRRRANAAAIADAAAILRRGGLVAMPTETVYGLAADATSDAAVARIYAAKGRPARNPLIAHVADLSAAEREGRFTNDARQLAEAFWPGPLTLVVPVRHDTRIGAMARAGLETIALRVPAHPVAKELIRQAGLPLAAPSANRSGHVSPVTADHVLADLADAVDLVLDDGRAAIGVESTIIACLDGAPSLLRPGGLTRAAAERVLRRALDDQTPGDVIAPGQLPSHYAPRTPLRLHASARQNDEAGLDFGGQFTPGSATLDLSPRSDLDEAARNLFDYLRRLDAMDRRAIVVAPIPIDGLGEALNDRLRRAAAPRDTMA